MQQIRPNGFYGLGEEAELARLSRETAEHVPTQQVFPASGDPSITGRRTQQYLTGTQALSSNGLTLQAGIESVPPPKGVIDAFVKTCQRWRLSEGEQLILLGYGDNEFFGGQILRGGWIKPPQDVIDRTGYILAISIGLGSIFNELISAELLWLNSPHSNLADRAPMQVMLEGKMKGLMIVADLVSAERAL